MDLKVLIDDLYELLIKKKLLIKNVKKTKKEQPHSINLNVQRTQSLESSKSVHQTLGTTSTGNIWVKEGGPSSAIHPTAVNAGPEAGGSAEVKGAGAPSVDASEGDLKVVKEKRFRKRRRFRSGGGRSVGKGA